jgi:hypothetical protein
MRPNNQRLRNQQLSPNNQKPLLKAVDVAEPPVPE